MNQSALFEQAVLDEIFEAVDDKEVYMSPNEVRTIREKIGYTQHQIAMLLDCTRERVALYEVGKLNVTLRHAEILSVCELCADNGKVPEADPETDWMAALGYLLTTASRLEKEYV